MDRNPTESRTAVEWRKTMMSLCTILNARQRTANGFQLLLSFMLIARATSKQVCCPTTAISCIHAWQRETLLPVSRATKCTFHKYTYMYIYVLSLNRQSLYSMKGTKALTLGAVGMSFHGLTGHIDYTCVSSRTCADAHLASQSHTFSGARLIRTYSPF